MDVRPVMRIPKIISARDARGIIGYISSSAIGLFNLDPVFGGADG